MRDVDQKFWPLQPRFSLVSVAILLVALLLAAAALRALWQWPSQQSETVVLIGILLLSLLPVAMALLDVIIARGAVIEYGKMKIDFSRSRETQATGITVASNIGVQGRPVTDSDTAQILDTLKQATSSEVVIVDLGDGHAWWETRLLVLLAGAVRHKKPDKIVFVARDANIDRRFQGWSYATDLLPKLVTAHPQYARSLESAWAAARQWELVEPQDALNPDAVTAPPPPQPPSISGKLATAHAWMAFDPTTGLPNKLFAEQILQSDLGQKIEMQQPVPRTITLSRFEELFRTVLNMESIDLSWSPERQLEAFLNSEAPFIAVTLQGKYSALVSRTMLSNEVLRSVAFPGKRA